MWVDPVQYPGQRVAAGTQQPVETAAKTRSLDLAGISRADRGQAVGIEQPGFDERDQTIEFDAVDRKKPRRQCELGKQGGGKQALIREIMDCEDRRDVAGGGRASRQIRGGKAAMPVMEMQDMRAPAGVGAARELRGDPAEEPEAAVVVGPIVPVRSGIGIARPIVEPRLVDQVCRELRARQPGETYPHPLRREGRLQPGDIGDAGKRIEKAPKAGQQEARVNTERGQCRR